MVRSVMIKHAARVMDSYAGICGLKMKNKNLGETE